MICGKSHKSDGPPKSVPMAVSPQWYEAFFADGLYFQLVGAKQPGTAPWAPDSDSSEDPSTVLTGTT